MENEIVKYVTAKAGLVILQVGIFIFIYLSGCAVCYPLVKADAIALNKRVGRMVWSKGDRLHTACFSSLSWIGVGAISLHTYTQRLDKEKAN